MRLIRSPSPEPSLTKFASNEGIWRKALNSAIERGDIPADCFEVGPNGRRFRRGGSARASKALKNRRQISKLPADATGNPDLPAGVDIDDPETWPLNLEMFKAIREYWSARQAKLKTEQAANDLVRVDEVRRDNFRAARMARDHLLGIPDQVADDLAAGLGTTDVEVVRQVIRDSDSLANMEWALMSFASIRRTPPCLHDARTVFCVGDRGDPRDFMREEPGGHGARVGARAPCELLAGLGARSALGFAAGFCRCCTIGSAFDLGDLDAVAEPVDHSGDAGGSCDDLVPFRKGLVGRNHDGGLGLVSSRKGFVEQVREMFVVAEIGEFIDDKELRGDVTFEALG